ncbi:hypothetical protein CR513_51139, partial [Mucuna pruriens]
MDATHGRVVELKRRQSIILEGPGQSTTPLLKCLMATQATYTMEEIHCDICELHFGGRTMASRMLRVGYYYTMDEIHCDICELHSSGHTMASCMLRVGYYWSTIQQNYKPYVHNCKECQAYGFVDYSPAEEL